MSAGTALVAGMVAALDGWPGLAGCAVFDAAPVRAGLPYVEVGEPSLSDWSGVGFVGREGRIAVSVVDDGERPVRLRALAGAVEDCLAVMPAGLEGWRVVRLAPARSRTAKGKNERWVATVEFQVRVVREE